MKNLIDNYIIVFIIEIIVYKIKLHNIKMRVWIILNFIIFRKNLNKI